MPRGSIEKLTGLVLGSRKTGEADRVVTVYSREFGLIRAIAKGVRKVPSRRGGAIQPFTRVSGMLREYENHAYLGSVDVLTYYWGLYKDAAAVESAVWSARLIAGLLPERVAEPSLFDLLQKFWEVLDSNDERARRLEELSLTLRVLEESGWLPDLGGADNSPLSYGMRRVSWSLLRYSHDDLRRVETQTLSDLYDVWRRYAEKTLTSIHG